MIFKNDFTVGGFFNFKDRVPVTLQSNVVYSYTCEQCSAQYYGETTRHLKTRVAEHRGLSARTGNPLSNPSFSSIRDHALSTGHDIETSNFNILYKTHVNNLKVSESVLIHKDKPSLNNADCSVPLNILI